MRRTTRRTTPRPTRPATRPRRPLTILALVLALSGAITACAPGATPAVLAPTFTVVANGTGFQYVDPPGVGQGAAVFDVHLRATNPNPYGLSLRTLHTYLYLDGDHAASATFRSGVHLPAHGTGDLTLRLQVPLATAPRLLSTIATLVTGGTTRYRLDAVVAVDAFGSTISLPRLTAARGSVSADLRWRVPEVAIAASGAKLTITSLTNATIEVPASLHNPGRLGYLVQTPRLDLQLQGRTVGTARLDRIAAPAGTTVPVTLRFEFNPLALGPALAAQLQAVGSGAGDITFVVRGPLSLQAPGIGSHPLAAASLLSGSVR